MTAPDGTHCCPTCGWRHSAPKARRASVRFVQAVGFTGVEVAAALHLDGLLAAGLWAIAAWNVVVVLLLVHGLAQAAVGQGARR